MKRYPRDPYWTRARFHSTCPCGTRIRKGDRIFYYPNDRTALCEKCGQRGAAELAEAKLLER